MPCCLLSQNYMYLMRYGNYTWWNPNTYQLLKQRSANASLSKTGGNYVGWYFYQVRDRRAMLLQCSLHTSMVVC